MDLVNVMIQGKPVVIFRKSSCCMSHSVESLIRGFGANLTVYELDRITNGQQIERALVQLGFRQSLPAVFIGQQLVGNERQVMSLHEGTDQYHAAEHFDKLLLFVFCFQFSPSKRKVIRGTAQDLFLFLNFHYNFHASILCIIRMHYFCYFPRAQNQVFGCTYGYVR
ncbi:hypothetical protein NC651_006960 [Populus alba x Populus x berolinensis]|nr:hypothetical protein NC651_006960 [Populus alba x Populus x berolinensis]